MNTSSAVRSWTVNVACEDGTRLLAECVAAKAAAGDVITLAGDLGAGKSTFARHFIRALIEDDDAEVPSPTFTLVQHYETPRFEVRHFDLYRLSGADELVELDFDDPDGSLVRLVEWPDRAEGLLPDDRLAVVLEEDGASGEGRRVQFIGHGGMARRLERIAAMHALLEGQLDRARLFRTRVRHLQGDASARSYARVLFEGAPGGGPEAGCAGAASALVMDMPRMGDGPIIRDGKTYSEIAHLAEDAGPFVAIAGALRAEGLAAPAIYAFEEAAGMALIEDFGDLTFGAALADGLSQDMLWHAALDVLIHLYDARPPETIAGAGVGGRGHVMPRYDADVMMAEVDLFCSWYWPMVTGETMVEDERGAFLELWREPIGEVAWRADAGERQHWVLRDFHSPNLLWRAEKSGLERVGLIDFQDAQIGHGGYDLMSLCEDARLDVAKALRDDLIARFCASVFDAGAPEGARAFRRGAAILGAQRNTKILGIFARLAMRDGKRRYLDHIPRIRRYLGWDLAHEDLGELRQWFADKLPGPS